MQKKALSLLLALAMVFSLAACAQTPAQPGTDPTPSASGSPSPSAAPSAEPSVEPTAAGTRSFTDSCGRTVEIPADISRIAPSGPMAQIVLFALAPDKFVGIASKWSKETESFIDGSYYNLPVLGQLYGSSAGELNLETLAAACQTGAELRPLFHGTPPLKFGPASLPRPAASWAGAARPPCPARPSAAGRAGAPPAR